MLALLGIFLVLGAVLGGYLMEHGNPWVLMQPAELLIIVGAGIGIVLVSNSPAVIRKMFRGIGQVFRPYHATSEVFLRHLRMLYEVFVYTQRAGGPMQLESDVEDPNNSQIFRNHPEFLKDAQTRALVCDSLRMMVIGVTSAHELGELMDLDIEVQRRGRHEPVNALASVADALPGLGIVAAVLGVVITMQAIGGAPETIGEKVAAALVGTFLGILLCYGVVGAVCVPAGAP
jgi:chemotaxis protein MotA